MLRIEVVRPLLLGLLTLAISCAAAAWAATTSEAVVHERSAGSGDPPPAPAIAAVTVRVTAVGCGWRSTGSGARIGPDLVVSNRHVVSDSVLVQVSGVGPTGSWTVPGTVVAVATDQDLVLIRLATAVPGPTLAVSTDGLALDEPVAVGGVPNGQRLAVRNAVVTSRWSRRAPSAAGPVWVLDEPAGSGMSGGPVVDRDGELVGVVFATEQASRTTLALGSDLVAQLLAEADAGGAEVPTDC